MARSKAKRAGKERRLTRLEAQQKALIFQQPNINHPSSSNNDSQSAQQGNGVAPAKKMAKSSGKTPTVSKIPSSSLTLSQLSLTGSSIQSSKPQHDDLFQSDAASGPQIGWKPSTTGQAPALHALRQIYKPDHIHPLGSVSFPIPLSSGADSFARYNQSVRCGQSQVMQSIHTAAAVIEPAQETSEEEESTVQLQNPKKKKEKKKKKKNKATVSSPPVTQSLRPRPGDRMGAPPLQKPKPTSQYISQANVSPRRIGFPQALLVVLDLNGTLLHRSKSTRAGTLRPNGDLFLAYLLAHHTVMIWSSARPENVAHMCTYLFSQDQRALLKAEWGRERLGLSAQQYGAKVQVYKRLEWVWGDEAIAVSHPQYEEGARWDQSNTVLIDDTTLKAFAQPHNLLEISEFTGKPAQMRLDVLRQVVGYLEELRWQGDVSSFMKQTPFNIDSGWDHQWPEDNPPEKC
ncbi:MAG: hypothetical protein M1812_002211 [Candelaria pacifica]|nr:MAG: hypothetical protein M1812_002211 [Candelaria pacifica]